MTDTVKRLISNAAAEAGIVAIGPINTRPEHDPYTNLDGVSSNTSLHIDPRDRTAWVSQEYRTNSSLMDIYNNLRIEIGIADHPDAAEVRAYLTGDGQALLRRICDGFEATWDGHNMVGRYNQDAQAAISTLELVCDHEGESIWGNQYEYWDVEDWVDVDAYGLTAEATDAELDAMTDEINNVAEAEHVVVSSDVLVYLQAQREQMREDASWDID